MWSCSILAIVFGAIGVRRARNGEATNGTMARWALWLGIVGLATWVLITLVVVVLLMRG